MDHFLLSANAVLPMFVQLAAGFLSQKAGLEGCYRPGDVPEQFCNHGHSYRTGSGWPG